MGHSKSRQICTEKTASALSYCISCNLATVVANLTVNAKEILIAYLTQNPYL